MSGVVRSAASFSARRAPAGVGGFHFSAPSPRNAIDVDYALWLFHKAMSLRTITVEWKSTCSRFGILFSGFPTFFLFFALRPFACDFSVLSIPGTQTSTPEKKGKIFNSYTNSKRSLTTPAKRGKHSGARLCIFISTSYIALFFIVRAMKTLLYVVQKKRVLGVVDVYDDTTSTTTTTTSKWSGVRGHRMA